MYNKQRTMQRNHKFKNLEIHTKYKVLIKTLSNLLPSKMAGQVQHIHGESHSKSRDKHMLLARTRECTNVKLIQQEAVSTLSKHQLTSLMSSKTRKRRRKKRIPISHLFRSWVRSKLSIMEEHTATVLKLCCNSRFKKCCSIIREELRY